MTLLLAYLTFAARKNFFLKKKILLSLFTITEWERNREIEWVGDIEWVNEREKEEINKDRLRKSEIEKQRKTRRERQTWWERERDRETQNARNKQRQSKSNEKFFTNCKQSFVWSASIQNEQNWIFQDVYN